MRKDIIIHILETTNNTMESPWSMISNLQNLNYGYGEKVHTITDEFPEDCEVGVSSYSTPQEREEAAGETQVLNQLMDIQGRMEAGMGYINMVTSDRDKHLALYLENKEEFKALMARLEEWTAKWEALSPSEKKEKRASWIAWKGVLWDKANPIKEARNEAYTLYQGAKAKLNKYWGVWKSLKNDSQKLVNGNKEIWKAYFSYLNSDLEIWKSDPKDLDAQKKLLDPEEHIKDMNQAHIKEMLQYSKENDVELDWSYQDARISARKEREEKGDEAILASSPW